MKIPWKRVAVVVGVVYLALVLHAAVLELAKLNVGRLGQILLVASVLDSVSIGWTFWKIDQKRKANDASEPD